MKTKRTKLIQKKIFSKENIRNLWEIINSEFSKSQKDKNHSSLELEIICADGISYESETDDLLKDGGIIDQKKCISINIEYHDFKLERRISLNLKYGGNYGNDLLVRGDKNWASGTFETLNNSIEAVKPQQHWFIRYKTIILHISAVFAGYLISEILDIFIKPIENPSENIQAIRDFVHSNQVFYYFVLSLIYLLQTIFLMWFLRYWIIKL